MTGPMFAQATNAASGGRGPRFAQLHNRLVLVTPVAGTYNPEAEINGDKARTWNVDLIVLDASHLGLTGGPLEYGGKGSLAEPHTDRITTPAIFKGVSVSNGSIVDQLTGADQRRTAGVDGGWILGVPYEGKGTKGNNPVHLGAVDVDPYGRVRPQAKELFAFAEQQAGAWVAGTLHLAEADHSELIQPGPTASPDVHKKYQERAAQRAARGITPAAIAAQAPAQPAMATVVGQQAPPTNPAQRDYVNPAAQYAPGAPVTAPSPVPGSPEWFAAQQVASAPANPDDAVPHGWTQTQWDTVKDPATRAMIWAQVRANSPS